jgi:hypothetical protein
VYVVWHKAVGPDLHGIARGIFLEPVEVAAVVGIGFENRLVAVPPLDDVVGVIDDGGAGEASHYDRLPPMDARGARAKAATTNLRMSREYPTRGTAPPQSINQAEAGARVGRVSEKLERVISLPNLSDSHKNKT